MTTKMGRGSLLPADPRVRREEGLPDWSWDGRGGSALPYGVAAAPDGPQSTAPHPSTAASACGPAEHLRQRRGYCSTGLGAGGQSQPLGSLHLYHLWAPLTTDPTVLWEPRPTWCPTERLLLSCAGRGTEASPVLTSSCRDLSDVAETGLPRAQGHRRQNSSLAH